MALLETQDLSKHFGGLAAVSNVTFDVTPGEILGVIGPNGAGKTTLFNLISGVQPASGGKVVFRGEQISGLRPDLIAARGLVRTFQASVLYANFTVRDNVMMGSHLEARPNLWKALWPTKAVTEREKALAKKADEIIEMIDLASYADELAKNLPHGYQRYLGVGVALAAQPKVLLLDEPMAGLNPEETNEFMRMVRRIQSTGVTMLLVEHDMRAVMGLCNRIIVLNYGRKIAEGTPEQIRDNTEVIEAYLGKEHVA